MIAMVRPLLVFALFLGAVLLVVSHEPVIRHEEEEEGHAEEAFDFWYGQRAQPFDKIPNGAYLRAFRYSQLQLQKERALSGIWADTTEWSSIGPDNVGGRVLAVAVHPTTPNIIWAGASSGGLWKSTTSGAGASAWTYVNTGYPTVAVSSIAIDSLNPSTMYIGTGEVGSLYARGQVGTPGARSSYGMGVLKSTDGGVTWAQTGLTYTFPQVTAVQKVLLNPKNPNTLFAATTEGTFKSIDAGTSWSLVHNVLMAMDIVINASDTTVLYAAYGQRNSTGGTQGLYKTTNAGTTWTLLAGGLPAASDFGRTSLAISASTPSIIYAGIANANTSQLRGLYRTTNAGTTWTLQTATNYVNAQGWYDNVIAVDPTNPSVVYCAGLDIYKSTDAGVTLNRQSYWYSGYGGIVPAGGPEGPGEYAHADHHAIAFHPTNSNTIYFGTDGGIFVSTDAGISFDGRNGGFVTTQFYNGFANSESDSLIALGGLQDNGTVKYVGGTSWDKTYGGDGGWCAIDPTNPLVMYEEYVYLAISKTVDGGASWFGATNGLATGSTNANFIAPFVISPSTPSVLYGGARVVYKSTDGGSNWFATNGGVNFNGTMVASIGVSSTSADTVICGTGSSASGATFQIFRTTNGGSTWTNVTGTNPNRYPTDIAFDQGSGTVAYLSYSGYGTPHVFKTTNAGATWTDISTNLPDIPVQCVLADPLFPNTIFAGTDLGMYRSTNGGTSWHVFDTGMPPAMITDLNISPVNRVIRASTFGNGVYERRLLTPDIFDYRALAFVSPTNGQSILLNSVLSPIRATFRNLGSLSPVDSFDVRFEILSGNTVVYGNTKRIDNLLPNEVVEVTFDGSYTAAAGGALTIRAISIAGDVNAANDTITGTINVLSAAPVASIPLSKEYCPFIPLASQGTPTPLAGGDDAQFSVALPFPVEFDSYTYDQLQISTNGWVELGTGPEGTERGLSSAAQIGSLGANQNGSLFTTAHPLKALGIWWEDMDVDGSALLSYATVGSAPTRRFIVEWNNARAYYDPVATTTRITFQIEFAEDSPVIRFHYGPVTAGLFGGSDIGAMVGVKDHVGGDFHYLDFTSGSTGTVAEGRTNLSPLTDWPGQDSCYALGTIAATATVPYAQRWNLVSVPLQVADSSIAAVFPGAIAGTTYRFTGGTYAPASAYSPGNGYWTKFAASGSQIVTGSPFPTASVIVDSGWNLVGSVDHSIAIPSDPIIASPFYGYDNGYIIAPNIEPGRAYWVKTQASGILSLGPVASPTSGLQDLEGATSVTITDASGMTQTLYLTQERTGTTPARRLEMPPPAPAGSFDLRFRSNNILERYPVDCGDGKTYPIALNGATSPLRVSIEAPNTDGKEISIVVTTGANDAKSIPLRAGVPTTITPTPGDQIAIRIANSGTIPAAYALGQNYPNPFNPTTTITFALPSDGDVNLAVYDLTGKEVLTLARGRYNAGSYSVQVNMGGMASGVYYYRMTSGSFKEVRKFVLLK